VSGAPGAARSLPRRACLTRAAPAAAALVRLPAAPPVPTGRRYRDSGRLPREFLLIQPLSAPYIASGEGF
jgi:hypothetical protein